MIQILLLMILSLGATTSSARTGTATSGGGGAFVQRESNPARTVTSALLIDLWEAKFIDYDWPEGIGTLKLLANSDALTVEGWIEQSLNRLGEVDPQFADQVRKDYEFVRTHVRALPAGIRLQLPADLKLDYYPQGYTPEGMMLFNGATHRLDVDEEIFSHLSDAQNTAAAWLHEAIYKTLRESVFAHQTSVLTRHLNACLLSATSDCLSPRSFELPTDRPVYFCQNFDLKYYLYPLTNTGWSQGYRVSFTRFSQPLSGDVHQDILTMLPNADGSISGATSGRLVNPLNAYGYSPGLAVIELTLSPAGELLQVVTRLAKTTLEGGKNLLTNGATAMDCKSIGVKK